LPSQDRFVVREVSPDARTHIIAVEGEADMAAAPELERCLTEAIAAGKTGVVVDLAGVTFIDSSAVHVLIAAHVRLARRARARLAIACNNARVYRFFELALLTDVLDIYATGDEALAAAADQSASSSRSRRSPR
jgi:anti-sigma B factor antagonist